MCFCSVLQIKDNGLLDDDKEEEEETQAADDEGITSTD